MDLGSQSSDGYEIEEVDGTLTCVVTGLWSSGAERLLDTGSVDGLDLNYAKGFCEPDLSFLKAWPLRRLKILDRLLLDLDPVARVAQTLEELSVQAAPGARLDLGHTPHLKALAGPWELVRSTVLARDRLLSIITWKYDDPDLLPLVDQSSLKVLKIKDTSRLESFRGVGALAGLERLGIHLARNLADVDEVGECASTLAEFELESCSQIMRLDPVAPLSRLSVLGVADCGAIESLSPIASMYVLEKLLAWGSTCIVDGDLSPLLALPHLRELRMKNRREYAPSVMEVQSRLVPPVT